jgi:transglutaminase-like putative cysteine protease
MNTLLRRTLYLFICLVSFLLLGNPAYATGEFSADYDVQYAVSPTGKTIVTQQVKLINKLSNFYPQSYSLLLDSDKISSIIAYDDGGIITPNISVKNGKTDIALHFNTKAVGLGKSLAFTLRYEHAGVVSRNGNIWELYLPGIINDPDIGLYNVTLNVPPTFGPVAYLSPLPATNRTWTKEQMIRGGVAAAYGLSQNFQVDLSYTLSNPSVVRNRQSITVPTNTAYQKVVIQSLNPSPESVETDEDGNWLAWYNLLPAQTLSIKAKLGVSVYLDPRKDFTQPMVDAGKYILPQPFWQINDPKIKAAAQPLRTPRAIYDYVVNTLSYDYGRVTASTNRLGAAAALAAPTTAMCMEFTDLFIALARSNGIPARRVIGFAYTNNPKLRPIALEADVLHAWPEYFDSEKRLWIPIDPTWANTTGGVDYFSKVDFNHITFAVNGISSELPYSAGFYHSSDKPQKDVSVEFAPSPVESAPSKVSGTLDFPSQVSAGTVVNGALVIRNTGGEAAVNIVVTVTSDIGGISLTQTIPELLPYGTLRIPLKATIPQSLSPQTGTIHTLVNETSQSRQFSVQPLYWLMLGIVLFSGSVIAILVILVRYIVWKRFKKH